MTIRQEILDAIDPHIRAGDSFRLVHQTKKDGTNCSVGKDPCLAVTRTWNGWVYKCHRCEEGGFIGDKQKSPHETKSMLDALKKEEKVYRVTKKVQLPFDFIEMGVETYESVPMKAFQWLWKYRIEEPDMAQFNIGWSEAYRRVIFPIYRSDASGMRRLQGWIGREVDCETKEERKAKKVAKYLTRKDGDIKRLFFTIEGLKPIVIVEDILSAITVHKHTHMTVVALLTTHIDDNTLKACKGRRTYIWLDPDALAKSVKYVNRAIEFGIDCKLVHTYKDPKFFDGKEINGFLDQSSVITEAMSK
jgi:hypothetical protein